MLTCITTLLFILTENIAALSSKNKKKTNINQSIKDTILIDKNKHNDIHCNSGIEFFWSYKSNEIDKIWKIEIYN